MAGSIGKTERNSRKELISSQQQLAAVVVTADCQLNSFHLEPVTLLITMIKEIWANLPVKDVKKSKEFFTALGFKFKTERESPQSVPMEVGTKGFIVMLFDEQVFKGFTKTGLPAGGTSEVLFSFDAESRQEVDEFADKVRKAGGKIFGEPGENQGWLYGFGFEDLDGHKWNMLHMDFSKMPR